MRYGNVCNFFAAVSFSGLFLASVLIARKEIFIATQAKNWNSTYILAQNGGLAQGFSIGADYAVIDACLRVASSADGLFLPSAVRMKLAATCQNLAAQITQTSPLNSYAWFAQARFAAIEGQTGVVNRALVRSYATEPTEQWLAEQRVPVAENMLVKLSPAARAGHRADLALLVQSRRGISAIAQRYVRDEGFRARIAAVVERLPEPDQARFVRVLQAAVRQR